MAIVVSPRPCEDAARCRCGRGGGGGQDQRMGPATDPGVDADPQLRVRVPRMPPRAVAARTSRQAILFDRTKTLRWVIALARQAGLVHNPNMTLTGTSGMQANTGARTAVCA